jgi:hypothetical protein
MMLRTCWIYVVLLAACVAPYERPTETVVGYVPVYSAPSSAAVSFQPPRTLADPGKIYRYGNYLLINERNKGIHVFDNSDRSKPVALGFVEIIGNSDMAVRNDVLFADNLGNSFQFKRRISKPEKL